MATNGRSPKTALKRFTLIEVLAMAIVTLGCSGPSTSAVAPTPAAPPAPNLVRLSGRVDDTAWRPLADVKVEMVDGPEAGASTTTDDGGQFAFSGSFGFAAGSITFRATKVGYADLLQKVNVSSDPFSGGTASGIGFKLVSLVPTGNIAGDYTLTLVADSTCTPNRLYPTGIPEELRSRTYKASITAVSNASIPPNTGFGVKVSGPFLINVSEACSNSFVIGVAGHDLRIGGDSMCDIPELVEQIDPRTFLAISSDLASSTVGTPPASTIAAAFPGYFDYCVLNEAGGSYQSCLITGQSVTHSRCLSNNHQLILTRR
jgi:hypothetical protein